MIDLISRFNEILPLACEWVESQEALILEKGSSVSSELVKVARRIGVAYPNKVKILVVAVIPRPTHLLLEAACDQTNFLTQNTAGLTLRYGIYIRSDCISNTSLYVHELTHVLQYERLGGIKQFLQRYLLELVTSGYQSVSLEQEAVNTAKHICGG
jgi:hypothetical protein